VNPGVAPQLLSAPQWRPAAQALVHGCLDLAHSDDAVRLLETVCRRLGDALYPAFLRLLCEIGRHGDLPARAAVARTLVSALRSGRLPMGRRAAWGTHASTTPASRNVRSLGPIEYMCAAVGDPQPKLNPGEFAQSAPALLHLVNSHSEARHLYIEHLFALAQDPLQGTLNRSTCHALRCLARAWQAEADPQHLSRHFLTSLGAAQSAANRLR
jgi:hypothetical protein